MKNIRIISLLLAFVLTLSLAACGGDNDKDSGKDNGGSASTDVFANIDLKSTEEQDVSSERATAEVLEKTLKDLYGDDGIKKLSYDEIKKMIGMDCSTYFFDTDKDKGVYIWKTEGENPGCLNLVFDSDGKLSMAGAINLSLS